VHILIAGSYAPSLLNFRGPLLRALVCAGYEVSVCAPNFSRREAEQLRQMGIKVHDIYLERDRLNIWGDLQYALNMYSVLKVIKPDLVLTYTIKPNIWGAFAASQLGIDSAAMVTGLGYAFTQPSGVSVKHSLVRHLARFLYSNATKRNRFVVFQNPDDMRDFISAGCLADVSKARLVNGSGVDMTHYRLAELPSSPVFLMIARLLGNKGVREYAMASSKLRNAFPEARTQLLGPIDEGPDAISSAELNEWVAGGMEYLGEVDDVRPALTRARIFVLPSYREGTPRSVLEAMAMGRPIITSDAPGCRETIDNNIEGYLVASRDPEALFTAMRAMLENPLRTEEMGSLAYSRARLKYDTKTVNKQMFEALGLVG